MNVNYVNINNMESIEVGTKVMNTRTNDVVKIEEIIDGKIRLEGKDRFTPLVTLKRWYKVVKEEIEGEVKEEHPTDDPIIPSEEKVEGHVEEKVEEKPHHKVKRNREVNCNIVPVEDVTLMRDELVTYCRGIEPFTEIIAAKYNTFYLDNVNVVKIRKGKTSFRVYLKETLIPKDLIGQVLFNPSARVNKHCIIVKDRETFKIARTIIKGMIQEYKK